MADPKKTAATLEDNPVEHINPFVKAIKDQRLDFSYVNSLRTEVIQLIEPFRVRTLETADILDETNKNLERINEENKAFRVHIEI